MKFISFIHKQICYGIDFFLFYLINFRISGMNISFNS